MSGLLPRNGSSTSGEFQQLTCQNLTVNGTANVHNLISADTTFVSINAQTATISGLATVGSLDISTPLLNSTTINALTQEASGAITVNNNLVDKSSSQSLTNKRFDDLDCYWFNDADSTKQLNWALGASSTATVLTINPQQTASANLFIPNIGSVDYMMTNAASAGVSNKMFLDNTCFHVSVSDNTKKIGFANSSATTGTTLTIGNQQTTSQRINFPNVAATDTVVCNTTAATLLNKSIVNNSTNFIDGSDATKGFKLIATSATTGCVLGLSSIQTNTETLSFPNVGSGDIIVTNNTVANLASKNLVDASTWFVYTSDNTISLRCNLANMTTGKSLTLTPFQTTSQQLNIPNITGTDTLPTLGLAQTFSGQQTFSNSSGILLPTSGGTPAGLNYYEEYSNTITLTGPWASGQSCNMYIRRIGKMVTCGFSQVNTTTNSSATITCAGAIPVRFYSASIASTIGFAYPVISNGTEALLTMTVNMANGNITFYANQIFNGPFGSGQNCGIGPGFISWLI
jgi:hypothetical protein